MWRGYELHLWRYATLICREWSNRGYKDGTRCKLLDLLINHSQTIGLYAPPWLGNRRFHESHRSNLLRKFPEHYRKFWPKLRDDLPYVWPSEKGQKS
jgi:hypothetical protein